MKIQKDYILFSNFIKITNITNKQNNLDGGIKINLKKIEIKNFMGVHDVTLDNLGIFNVIIGKNKTGKSSILKLLANYKVNDNFWVANKKFASEKGENKPIELLKLIWELDSEDIIQLKKVSSSLKNAKLSSTNLIMVTEHKPLNNHSAKFYSDQNLSKLSYELPSVAQTMFQNTILGGKIINMIPCVRYLSTDFEKRITEIELVSNKQDPEFIFYTNQDVMVFDQIFNWIDIKNRKREEIQEFINIIRKLINVDLEINEFEAGNDFQLSLDYEELGLKFERAFRTAGHATQQLVLILYYCFFQKNHLILIDEIEIGLHPSLLRYLYNVLYELSERNNNQLIVSTHSSVFLDLCPNVYLLENAENGSISYNHSDFITIRAIDELIDPDPIDSAFILSRDEYSLLIQSGFDELNLNMINKIHDYFKPFELFLEHEEGLDEYKKILKLGTTIKHYNSQLLQNVHFLSSTVEEISLNYDDKLKNKLKKIVICQINKIKVDKTYKNREEQFKNLCKECWNPKFQNILTYSPMKAEEKRIEIIEHLKKLKKYNKINNINQNSIIIVFPENSFPYIALENLIKFATNEKVIIVGGMEHKKIGQIKKIFSKLPHEYQKRLIIPNYNQYFKKLLKKIGNKDTNPFDPLQERDLEVITNSKFLNQAIIINSDKRISFQIKNIPVYFFNKEKNRYDKEGIPSILIPHFKKFKTVIGNLAILICKDFLVNYEIIPQWMEKNDINIIIIPSFTQLVKPFQDKIGEIMRNKKNEGKIFVFASLAEYGGSGVYCYKKRKDYEPGKKGNLEPGEEKCKEYII